MRTEDGYIIYKCLNGDPAAFGLLVDKYKASIYALAYSKLRNFHDAEDVTQEVFIKAFQKLRALRWWDSFLAWLYAITSNLCKQWIRSQSKRPDREFIADQEPNVLDRISADASIDSYRSELVYESIHEALDSLPEKYRQALTLHYLGGMKSREIARFLGTSTSTITKRLAMGRARLKAEMIATMDRTYEQRRLKEDFTFRIMAILKGMRIRPVPPIPWLPWGISAATGIIIAALSFTSNLIPFSPIRMGSAIPDQGTVELLSWHSDMEENPLNPYSQRGEMSVYAYVPVTLEMTPGSAGDVKHTETQTEAAGSADRSPVSPQQGQAVQMKRAMSSAASSDAGEKTTISGKVLKDDMPVPNARVYIYGTNLEDTTWTDGSFRFEIPKPGSGNWTRLSAIAQHPRYSFGWASVSEDNAANVVIRLRQPAAITGMIADEHGDPIQGADVRIDEIVFPFSEPGAPLGDYLSGAAIPTPAVRTDTDGTFAFRNLPEGAGVDLHIVRPGYAIEEKHSIRAGTEGLAFKSERTGRIEGRVTLGETGEAARNVAVRAQGIYPTTGQADARTDERGYYVLTGLSPGEYNVVIRNPPPAWAVTAVRYVEVVEEQVTKNIDLQLVGGGLITGRVADKDTNEPIQNCYLYIRWYEIPVSATHTDENGFYRFRTAPGKVLIGALAPEGYKNIGQAARYVDGVDIDVAEGETVSGIDFQFQKTAQLTVTGRTVSIGGVPIAGAAITDRLARSRTYATSDRDGRFVITGLQQGQRLRVEARHGELQLRGYADMEVQPGLELEILMQEKYEVINVPGRVVDEHGVGIASAKLSLWTYDRYLEHGLHSGHVLPAGMTDSSGKYTMHGMIVGDEYMIKAIAEGYMEAGTGFFRATANMSRLEDIVLIPYGDFFLEGRVIDTDGKPVVGARVFTRSVDRRSNTDENGYYRLHRLPFVVEKQVDIYHPDYGHHWAQYVPTNQTQDFVIVKAGRYLAGKVVDAHGNPVAGVYVWAYSRAEEASGYINTVYARSGSYTNPQGEFRLENLLYERESIQIRSNELNLSRIFENVETNRDDAVFVFDKSVKQPQKTLTAEEIAERRYRD